jgi:hypothetical protein
MLGASVVFGTRRAIGEALAHETVRSDPDVWRSLTVHRRTANPHEDLDAGTPVAEG